MAKSKTSADEVVTLEFLRTGNPWVDAGIVGLSRVLRRKPSYLKSVPEQDDADAFPQVSFDDLREDRLVITGPTDRVQACLEWAYDRLIEQYYNVSSQKQQRKEEGFFFDSRSGQFVRYAKKRPVGAALLLFDKKAKATDGQVEWKTFADKKTAPKRKAPLLPCSQLLQAALDDFLVREGLQAFPRVWTPD